MRLVPKLVLIICIYTKMYFILTGMDYNQIQICGSGVELFLHMSECSWEHTLTVLSYLHPYQMGSPYLHLKKTNKQKKANRQLDSFQLPLWALFIMSDSDGVYLSMC